MFSFDPKLHPPVAQSVVPKPTSQHPAGISPLNQHWIRLAMSGKARETATDGRSQHRHVPDGNGLDQGLTADSLGLSSNPLNAPLRYRLEKSFGESLGDVRVHAGAESNDAATSLGARAFTMGQDIHVGSIAELADTAKADRLLAHEVVHTIQQASTSSSLQAKLDVSAPNDPAEREADRLADAFAIGETGLRVSERTPPRIQRDSRILSVPEFAPLPRRLLPNQGRSTDNLNVSPQQPQQQQGPNLGVDTRLHIPGSHQTSRFHHWTRGAAIRHNREHPEDPRAHTGGLREVEEFVALAQPGDTGMHDGIQYTVYADEIRWGGADVWRNNSPGIMGNRWEGRMRFGAIGIGTRRGLAIFPTPEAGENATAQINLNHLHETIRSRIAGPETGYAPPGENDSEHYISNLLNGLNHLRDEERERRRTAPRPEDATDPLPPPFTDATTLLELFPPSVRRSGHFDPQSPYFHRFVRTIMEIEGMFASRNQGIIYRRDSDPPPPLWVQRLLGM
jgi:hypothetical protein